MPNWCENDLTIRGPSTDVHEFLEQAEGESPFNFGKLIPYPEQFRHADEIAEVWDSERRSNPDADRGPRPKDGFNSGGYEWCVKNWGTKWPATAIRIEDGKETDAGFEVVIGFDTAWTPPKPVVLKASELFASLVFELRYYECGDGFCGEYVVQNGECVRDESSEYHGSRGG
jgi:Ferredoxin-like domain in Api92-like protein